MLCILMETESEACDSEHLKGELFSLTEIVIGSPVHKSARSSSEMKRFINKSQFQIPQTHTGQSAQH